MAPPQKHSYSDFREGESSQDDSNPSKRRSVWHDSDDGGTRPAAQDSEKGDDQDSEAVDDQYSETVDDQDSETVDDQDSETVDDQDSETVDDQDSETVDYQYSETVDYQYSETVDYQDSETVDDQDSETVDDQYSEPDDDQDSETVDYQYSETFDYQDSETVDDQDSETVDDQYSEPDDDQDSETDDDQDSETVDDQYSETVGDQYSEPDDDQDNTEGSAEPADERKSDRSTESVSSETDRRLVDLNRRAPHSASDKDGAPTTSKPSEKSKYIYLRTATSVLPGFIQDLVNKVLRLTDEEQCCIGGLCDLDDHIIGKLPRIYSKVDSNHVEFDDQKMVSKFQRLDKLYVLERTVLVKAGTETVAHSSKTKKEFPVLDTLVGYKSDVLPDSIRQPLSDALMQVDSDEAKAIFLPVLAWKDIGDGGCIPAYKHESMPAAKDEAMVIKQRFGAQQLEVTMGESASFVHTGTHFDAQSRASGHEPFNNVVFSIIQDIQHATLFVSWRRGCDSSARLHVQPIGEFCVQDKSQRLVLDQCVNRIIEWGENDRLKAVRDAFPKIELAKAKLGAFSRPVAFEAMGDN